MRDAELAERKATLRPGDPINIQYTSARTGFPTGATLSHRNIRNTRSRSRGGIAAVAW